MSLLLLAYNWRTLGRLIQEIEKHTHDYLVELHRKTSWMTRQNELTLQLNTISTSLQARHTSGK